MAAADILGSFLFLALQLGMTFGVGAETVLLGLTARAYTDETIRLVKRILRLALWLIIVSGVLITLAHLIAGDSAVFQPSYILKWILIFSLVVLNALARIKSLPQKLMAALVGSTWYAMFMLNTFAPAAPWMPLLIVYGVWEALFVGGFMLLRLKQVPALSFEVALKQAASSAPPPAPKPVKRLGQDISPKVSSSSRIQEIFRTKSAPAPRTAMPYVAPPPPPPPRPAKIKMIQPPALKLQPKGRLQGLSLPKYPSRSSVAAHFDLHPPELNIPPKTFWQRLSVPKFSLPSSPASMTPPAALVPTPVSVPEQAQVPELAPNYLPQEHPQEIELAVPMPPPLMRTRAPLVASRTVSAKPKFFTPMRAPILNVDAIALAETPVPPPPKPQADFMIPPPPQPRMPIEPPRPLQASAPAAPSLPQTPLPPLRQPLARTFPPPPRAKTAPPAPSPADEPKPFEYRGLSHVNVMPRSPDDLKKNVP